MFGTMYQPVKLKLRIWLNELCGKTGILQSPLIYAGMAMWSRCDLRSLLNALVLIFIPLVGLL